MITKRSIFGVTGWTLRLPGAWQLELWWCPRGSTIPLHVHWQIDSWLVFLGGSMLWGCAGRWRRFTWRNFGRAFFVGHGIEHGASTLGRFGLFANLERWRVPEKTSASVDIELTT